MAKKSTKSKKARASSRRAKPARRKAPSRKTAAKQRPSKVARKTIARKKTARKKTARKKVASKRVVRARPKARAARKRAAPSRSRVRSLGPGGRVATELEDARGLGPESGGQSGDIEGLPRQELADSESVEELAEEGQAFEAGIVDAVENAPEGEIHTREVPEDDVPEEYLDED